LGADAVAIGTAALIACACQQYRMYDAGKYFFVVTTQDPELRKRLKIDISAQKLENFLKVSAKELEDFARMMTWINWDKGFVYNEFGNIGSY